MNGRDRAGAAAERVRARLAATGAARRDAVARLEAGATPYDADEEITGRFLALSEKQAETAAQAVRLAARASRPDESLPPVVRRARRWGRSAAAIAAAGGGFAALAKWVLHWF